MIAAFFASLIMSAVGSLYFGWMFMLAVGVIHHDWIHQLPTLGYWWAVLIILLVRMALQSWGGDSD